eukprot:374051_1
MINGSYHAMHKGNMDDVRIIKQLISHNSAIPVYIQDNFKAFVENKQNIKINIENMQKYYRQLQRVFLITKENEFVQKAAQMQEIKHAVVGSRKARKKGTQSLIDQEEKPERMEPHTLMLKIGDICDVFKKCKQITIRYANVTKIGAKYFQRILSALSLLRTRNQNLKSIKVHNGFCDSETFRFFTSTFTQNGWTLLKETGL